MDKNVEKLKGDLEHTFQVQIDEWGLIWLRGRILRNLFRDKLVADLAEEHMLGLRESNMYKPHGL